MLHRLAFFPLLFAALFATATAQVNETSPTSSFETATLTSTSGGSIPTSDSDAIGFSGSSASSSSSHSFPAGAIAGIVIGFLVILALLVFALFYVHRRHQRASERTGMTVPEACAAGIRAERRIFDLEEEVRVLHTQVASLVAQTPMFVHVHEKEAEAMEEGLKAKELEYEKEKAGGRPPTYVD
ncbi:hypothetical protein C8F01DRAFT_289805 [Mycena amicta]|nr:hypothetical protein C8F01DRAFT_289805 [Mycena amicta]